MPRSHGNAISIAFSSFAFKQMPLRLQANAIVATTRCHCGYKQIPLRRHADATAATSRCHCGYKQMPLRLHTVNKTTDRPNIQHHSCPTSSHTLYSRSSSLRRMIRPVSTFLCSSQRASLYALPSVRCFHSYAESYAETYAARITQIGVNSPIVDIDVLFECSPVVDMPPSPHNKAVEFLSPKPFVCRPAASLFH